jgi:hypothetical protein
MKRGPLPLPLETGAVRVWLPADELVLSGADLAEIERLAPANTAAGDGYHARGMAGLDSERGRSNQRG